MPGVGFFWVLAGLAATAPSKVMDLGHPLSPGIPSWSGEAVFERTETGSGSVSMGRFKSEEHFSTHLDAPSHFAPGKWTVDQIPPERLVRPGYCIHVEDKAKADEDYRVSLADIKAFESREGAIPQSAIVLVATGWDRRLREPGRYMNEKNKVKHFPGISIEAAAYLARERKVAGIGIDTPSVDYGPSEKYETHNTTMPENVYHIENATRLTELPAKGFTVVVAPIKIAGGSGGPTRLFALLP